MSDDVAIGIDLGTSNSCVSWSEGENVDVLANAFGENVTASVVAFGEDGAITVGNAAKANIIHDPRHTVYSAKRLIGRYYFSDEVKKAQAVSSYRIVEGPSHGIRIQIRKEQFSLPEVSAMVLREMKGIAEDRLGRPVKQAVITVPAYFNDNQRQATRDAGRIAGLEVLRLLNEPTAAALAYGFGRGLNQRVAVYDLGGGTFDISILEIGRDVFEVLSTCGDTYLGGDDFDDRIIDLVADEFLATEGLNLRSDPYALEKLKVAAENAKKGLSVEDEVEINIPDIMTSEDGSGRSIQRTIATAEYASLVMDLIQRTFKVCDEALQQANMIARDLDGVILVGGPTRLPLIRSAVSDYFQQEAQTDVDPDEVVAMGAAIHAASLTAPTQESYLLDVTPLSLRIGVAGGLAEAVIDRNTAVPIEQTRAFTTVQDDQERVQIRVYQGESRQAEENELLGQFEFSGFEKKARGEVTIDVTFEINGDGIVNVLAEDRETGRQASTEITFSSGLTNTEIEKIIEDGATERVQTNGSQAPQSAAAPAAAAPAVAPSEDLAILPQDDDDGDLFGDEPPDAAAQATSRPVQDDVDVLLTDDGDDHDLELDPAEEDEPEMVIERPPTLEAAAEPVAPPPTPAPPAIEPASEVHLEAAGLDDAVAGEIELTPDDLEGLGEIELGSEDQLDDLDADAGRIGGAPEFAPEDFEEDENASTQPELEVEVAAAAPTAADAQPDADAAPEKAKAGLFGDVGTNLSEL